jgi:hypothetical protein
MTRHRASPYTTSQRTGVGPVGNLALLIIYLDGLVFGEHHFIGAVGVDAQERE